MPEPLGETEPVRLSQGVYRWLEALAEEQNRTVRELVEQAVEIQFGDSAAQARMRLIDRLARLEGQLGDPEQLYDQIGREARRVRALE